MIAHYEANFWWFQIFTAYANYILLFMCITLLATGVGLI